MLPIRPIPPTCKGQHVWENVFFGGLQSWVDNRWRVRLGGADSLAPGQLPAPGHSWVDLVSNYGHLSRYVLQCTKITKFCKGTRVL